MTDSKSEMNEEERYLEKKSEKEIDRETSVDEVSVDSSKDDSSEDSVVDSNEEVSTDKRGDETEEENFPEKILSSTESSVSVAQGNDLTTWKVVNLYDSYGNIKSKRELNSNPPSLVVMNSDGDEASFLLTKELSGNFSKILKEVYNAYYGIKPFRESTPKEKVKRSIEWMKDHIFISSLIGIFVLILLVNLVLSLFNNLSGMVG